MQIDFERTRTEYRKQLDSFMESFIMTCSPFGERQDRLEQEATERMDTPWCFAGGFCSYRRINKIYNIQNPGFNPYLEIDLEPDCGMLTSNWFIWSQTPCFQVPFDGGKALMRQYGHPTRSGFLDIEGSEAQLDYLKNNVGGRILLCYTFDSVNDFGKQRWCYRFATEGYLREAILRTQGFALDYLSRHPLDCFDGPYIQGRPDNESACAGETKRGILYPILEEYLQRIRERKEAVDTELRQRGFTAECI